MSTAADLEKLILADTLCRQTSSPMDLWEEWGAIQLFPDSRGSADCQKQEQVSKHSFEQNASRILAQSYFFLLKQVHRLDNMAFDICVNFQGRRRRRSGEKLLQGKCRFSFATIHLVAQHTRNTEWDVQPFETVEVG